MKVIINFGEKKVVVPCGIDGDLSIRELTHLATAKYCKLSYSSGSMLHSDQVQLRLLNGAVVDPDDRVGDVVDDREELFAIIDFHQINYPSHTTMNSNGELSSSVTSSNLSSSLSEHDRLIIPSSNPRHEVVVTDADLRTRSLRVRNDPNCHSQRSLSHQSSTSSFNSKMTQHRPTHSPPTHDATRIPSFDDVRRMHNISLDDKTGDQIFTIRLPKDTSPLGIHVVPCNADEQHVNGLVLQNIEADGRIKRQGILQINDRIIEINRTNIERCSFDQAQLVFRTALLESELELKIHRRAKSISSRSTLAEINSNNDQSFVDNDSYMNSLNTRRLGKKIKVSLVKGHDGLGFKLASRDNPTGAANPIYVKTIFPKGAAIEDGRLQRGDRLLTVNSLDVTQMSLQETVGLLRDTRVGDTVELCVSRQYDGLVSHDMANDEIQITDEPPSIEMKGQQMTFDIPLNDTSSAGLGITLKGKTSIVDGQSVDLGIFVKSILTGGAASRDNRLRPNDQLLVINDSSLIHTSNLEAATILHEAVRREIHPGYIKVTVSRFPISTNEQSMKYVRETDLSPLPSLVPNDENELDLTTFVPPPPLVRKLPSQQSTRHSARRAESETRPTLGKTSDEVDSNDVNPFDRETPFRQSVSEKRRVTHQPNKQAVQWKQRSFHERKQPTRPLPNSSSTANDNQHSSSGIVRSSSFKSIRLRFEEQKPVGVKPVNEEERKRQAKLRSRACNDSFRQAVDKSYCQNGNINDEEMINKSEKQRFRFANLFTTKSKRKDPQDDKIPKLLLIQHQSPPQPLYPPPPAAFSSRQDSSSSTSSASFKKPPKIQNNNRPVTVFSYSSTEQQGYQPYRFNSNQTQFHC